MKKRILGFALFCIAIGIVISMFLPNSFIEALCILFCVFAGYNLYC